MVSIVNPFASRESGRTIPAIDGTLAFRLSGFCDLRDLLARLHGEARRCPEAAATLNAVACALAIYLDGSRPPSAAMTA